MHPQCALAVKLRFDRIEEGAKRLKVAFVDSDGTPVMPGIDATTQVGFTAEDPTATASLVLNIQQLKLPRFGEYSIDLAVAERHEFSIPLFVARIP